MTDIIKQIRTIIGENTFFKIDINFYYNIMLYLSANIEKNY